MTIRARMEIGIIYIAHTGDAIDAGDLVFKVGRTKCISSRLNQYPKGTCILRYFLIRNQKGYEKSLHDYLQKQLQYKQRLDYGDEYYETDSPQQFIQNVSDFVNNDNSACLPEYLMSIIAAKQCDVTNDKERHGIHEAVFKYVGDHVSELQGTCQTVKSVNKQICPDRVCGPTAKAVMSSMLRVSLRSSNPKYTFFRDEYVFPDALESNLKTARRFHSWFCLYFRTTANVCDKVDGGRVYEGFKLAWPEEEGVTLTEVLQMAMSYGCSVQRGHMLTGVIYRGETELPPTKEGAGQQDKYTKACSRLHLEFLIGDSMYEQILSGTGRSDVDEEEISLTSVAEEESAHEIEQESTLEESAITATMEETEGGTEEGCVKPTLPIKQLRKQQMWTYQASQNIWKVPIHRVDTPFFKKFIGPHTQAPRIYEVYVQKIKFNAITTNTIEENQSEQMLKCLSTASDESLQTRMEKNALKHRQQLMYAQELLTVLFDGYGYQHELKEHYTITIRAAIFKKRLQNYLGSLTEEQFKAIVSTFSSLSEHGYKNLETVRKSKYMPANFVKHMLKEAFCIIFYKPENNTKKRVFKADMWATLAQYQT